VATATAQALAPTVSENVTANAGLATATATALAASGSLVRNPLHLGATLTLPSPDATATEADTGGTVVTVANLLGGSALAVTSQSATAIPQNSLINGVASPVSNTLGGTLTLPAFGASTTGWTMQTAPLAISEFNDETINIAVTNNGSPYNLTGIVVQMLFKTAAGTPDNEALVFSSTGGSPAITITNASGGLATAVIPNSDLDAETYNFYRIDVVVSGLINTCLYGPITWTSL
jgi:hypothetical protein